MSYWNASEIYGKLVEWGKLALSEQNTLTVELKPDDSIVTQVDKKIEELATTYFTEKGCFLIGEESVKEKSTQYLQKAHRATSFIIDPIDGTCPYSTLQPLWGIFLGYAEQALIKEGAILLPATYEVIITEGHVVLYGKGSGEFPDFNELQPIDIEVVKQASSMQGRQCAIAQSIFTKRYLGDAKIMYGAFYSCVYPIVYLALGRFKAMAFILNVWDFAAGMAIFSKLGFYQCLEDRTPLSLNYLEHFDWSNTSSGKVLSTQALYFAPNESIAHDIISRLAYKSLKEE